MWLKCIHNGCVDQLRHVEASTTYMKGCDMNGWVFDNMRIRSEVVWSKPRHLVGLRNPAIHFSPTDNIFNMNNTKANIINAFHTIML